MKRSHTMHLLSNAVKTAALPLLLVWLCTLPVHAGSHQIAIQGESGVETSALPAATITIPPALEIRDHREAVVETILQKAAEALNERGLASETARFSLSPRWIPNRIAELSPSEVHSVTPKSGEIREYTLFEVLTPGGSIDIQLQVEQSRVLPVAAQRILSGEELTVDQFATEWVDVTRLNGDYVTDLDEIRGMQLRRTLLAGQPVRRSDIWTPPVVSAGDQITLVFMTDFMQVTIPATARQDGQPGDVIRIYSSETRRTYLAEVSGPGEVLWKQTL